MRTSARRRELESDAPSTQHEPTASAKPRRELILERPLGAVQGRALHEALGRIDVAVERCAARSQPLSSQASATVQARLEGAFQRLESGSGEAGEVHAAAAEGIRGSGERYPYADRIQASFGRHDISGVRAFMGAAAQRASAAIGALAYASGERVAFGRAPDLFTAAHEAAHVVQQRGGVSLRGGVGQAGDVYEQHADEVASRVVQGRSAEPLLDRFARGTSGSGSASGLQKREDRDADRGDDTSEGFAGVADELTARLDALVIPEISGSAPADEALESVASDLCPVTQTGPAPLQMKAGPRAAGPAPDYAKSAGDYFKSAAGRANRKIHKLCYVHSATVFSRIMARHAAALGDARAAREMRQLAIVQAYLSAYGKVLYAKERTKLLARVLPAAKPNYVKYKRQLAQRPSRLTRERRQFLRRYVRGYQALVREQRSLPAQRRAARAEFARVKPKLSRGLRRRARRLYSTFGTTGGGQRGLRGLGVGGVNVAFGQGQIVQHEEILAGKLKPGASLQAWWPGKGARTGRQAYSRVLQGKSDLAGHSLVFVDYTPRKDGIIVVDQITRRRRGFSFAWLRAKRWYLIGTNVVGSADGALTAEHVLQHTRFNPPRGLDRLQRLKRSGYDLWLIGFKLRVAILASGQTKLLAAARRITPQQDATHDLVRLVGLYQLSQAPGSRRADGVLSRRWLRRLAGAGYRKSLEAKKAPAGGGQAYKAVLSVARGTPLLANVTAVLGAPADKVLADPDNVRRLKTYPLEVHYSGPFKSFIAAQSQLPEPVRRLAAGATATDLTHPAHQANLNLLVAIAEYALMLANKTTENAAASLGPVKKPRMLDLDGVIDPALLTHTHGHIPASAKGGWLTRQAHQQLNRRASTQRRAATFSRAAPCRPGSW